MSVPVSFLFAAPFCFVHRGLVLRYAGKYILTSRKAFATMKVALYESKSSDFPGAATGITDRNNLINLEGGYL